MLRQLHKFPALLAGLLVSVLALPDLLYSAQMIYSRTYQTIPLLIVATIWYLALATILTAIEHRIERRLAVPGYISGEH